MGFLSTRDQESPLDIVADKRVFSKELRNRHASELRDVATKQFAEKWPAESARSIDPRNLALNCLLPILVFAIAAFLIFPPFATAATTLFASSCFIMIAGVRIWLALLARSGHAKYERMLLRETDLPIVTILAPLYREAHALPGLVQAISRLDYPPEKIDVKLLLEQEDQETIDEAFRLQLDERFDLVIIPPSHPQTKPKACNYGLACARGDLIVIYDAEDEPEPEQLRIAAEIFATSQDDLACVQAKLNYYNPDENWLTRLFTLEYCLWFDHFLPALDRLGAPVPLGGTSNIFRTDILAEVGGWDPYNVTEDADLGLRLARRGYRTAVIDTTTYEEANCRIGNWMRQRSRWMKGFMQTWLVHRNAAAAPRDWREILAVDLFVGGTVAAALLNPFLWAALIAEWKFGLSLLAPLPSSLAWALTQALAAANLSFMALAAYAPVKRGLWRLSPAALLTPVYWIMMSIAAWIAFFQLLRRPSYWEKTDHGLSGEAKLRRAAALEAFGLAPDGADRQFDLRNNAEPGAGSRSRMRIE